MTQPDLSITSKNNQFKSCEDTLDLELNKDFLYVGVNKYEPYASSIRLDFDQVKQIRDFLNQLEI